MTKLWRIIIFFFISGCSPVIAQLPYQVQLFDQIGTGYYLPDGTGYQYLRMSPSGDSIGFYTLPTYPTGDSGLAAGYGIIIVHSKPRIIKVDTSKISTNTGVHDTANKSFRRIDSNQVKNAITLTYALAHFIDSTLAAGTGISISRSGVITITNTKPDTGISVSTGLSINRALNQRTLTNTKPDTAILGGTDISITRSLSANTINFTGSPNDTVLKAGNGISISRSGTGNTITNTLPDTAIVNGNGITISRSSTKNTITNSLPDTALVVSTGLSITRTSSKNTLTNTKPDTGLIAGTNITITRNINGNTINASGGSYPVDSNGYFNTSNLASGYFNPRASQSLSVSSKTIAWNVQNGGVAYVTLTSGDGVDTLALSHVKDGGVYTIMIAQPGSGSTVTICPNDPHKTVWYTNGLGASTSSGTNLPVLSTTLGYQDILQFIIINGNLYVSYGTHFK